MVPWGRRVVVVCRMVRARPVVVPAVIVHVNQVRVPFKAACPPTPGIVVTANPYTCAVAQSRVAIGINIVDHMGVVHGNIYIFLSHRFDDNCLFFNDFHLLVTL